MESLDAKGLSSPELSHGVGEVTLPCRGPAQEGFLRPGLMQTPAWRNLLFTWCNPLPHLHSQRKRTDPFRELLSELCHPLLPLPTPLFLLGARCVSCDSSSLSLPECVGKRRAGWGSTWLLSPSGRVAPRLHQAFASPRDMSWGGMFTAKALLPTFLVCFSALI